MLKPNEILENHFRFLHPVLTPKGYYIIGAVVGAGEGLTYTKRVNDRSEIKKQVDELRKQIHRDHPNIVEDVPLSTLQMAKAGVL